MTSSKVQCLSSVATAPPCFKPRRTGRARGKYEKLHAWNCLQFGIYIHTYTVHFNSSCLGTILSIFYLLFDWNTIYFLYLAFAEFLNTIIIIIIIIIVIVIIIITNCI
jgi:hypothetical protein